MQILYLTYNYKNKSSAQSANTDERKRLMEKLGHTVTLFSYGNKSFLKSFKMIVNLTKKNNVLYIRIDGSNILDKFTLVKLFCPNTHIIWEIHGFNYENLELDINISSKLISLKKSVMRFFYSLLSNQYIYISQPLQKFSKNKLSLKKYSIIPNFIRKETINKILEYPQTTKLDILNNSKKFKVIWGGSLSFKWHALDTLEKVSNIIKKKDKSIIFIVCGSNPWYPISHQENILSINTLPRFQYLQLVQQADICLALYHNFRHGPNYFSSLKLLEYMALAKPSIVTKNHSSKILINHKKNGFLTNNDPNKIATDILMLKSKMNLCKKVGQQAQEDIFSKEKYNQTMKLYKHVFMRVK